MWVRYTFPTPILTPFDFILAKINNLVALIVAFISKYDERMIADMDARTEIIPGVASKNWLEDFEFRAPLHGPYIEWSLNAIYAAMDSLSKHYTEVGDERRPNPPQRHNEGYMRRLQVLRGLSVLTGPHNGSFHRIALYLNGILQDEDPRHLVASRQRDLDDLRASDLHDLAMNIHQDILKALRAFLSPGTGLEYNYEGPAPAGG